MRADALAVLTTIRQAAVERTRARLAHAVADEREAVNARDAARARLREGERACRGADRWPAHLPALEVAAAAAEGRRLVAARDRLRTRLGAAEARLAAAGDAVMCRSAERAAAERNQLGVAAVADARRAERARARAAAAEAAADEVSTSRWRSGGG